jgi:hypothetical protein
MITNIIKRPLVKFVRNLSILSQQPKLISGNSSMRLTDTSFTIQQINTTKTNTIVLQKRNSAHVSLNFFFFIIYNFLQEPHTLTTVKDRIMLVLNLYDKIDNSKLTMDSDFFMDLGLDSLDFVEVFTV